MDEDAQKFVTVILEADVERYIDDVSNYYHSPFVIDDLFMRFSENPKLPETVQSYFLGCMIS